LSQNLVNDFWLIVKKYIKIPSKKIFKLESLEGGYFTQFIMWGFCCVLLNKDKGIVIYAKATD